MLLEQYLNDDLLIICPNTLKLKILKMYNNSFHRFKFMNIEEFKSHYYFSYNNKTIAYLMEKYHYQIDVCKTYLEQLYVIDMDKVYKSDKLIQLQQLKKDLIDNNLLVFDSLFSTYLKTKKIIVFPTRMLNKYEEEMLKDAIFINTPEKLEHHQVVCCNNLEDELLWVIEKILDLVDNNVMLNKIYLTNVTEEYLYPIYQLFSYFKIPINIDLKESLYGTKIVKEYLESSHIPAFINKISTKLLEVVNSLVDLEDSKFYQDFLIDKLKHTYIPSTNYSNAINIISFEDAMVDDDEYLFVLGMNQDVLPKTYKDEDFIPDSLKDEVMLYTSKEKNQKSKEIVEEIFKRNKNIFISCKEQSSFNSYTVSSFISELQFELVNYERSRATSSNIYNKLFLGELMDEYIKYGNLHPLLPDLLGYYKVDYMDYNNRFSGISSDKVFSYMNSHLNLSYTSLNTYRQCPFKYYIRYILKLDPYVDTFSIFIGNLCHYIFSVMYEDNFNFSYEWDHYIEKFELNEKELCLLDKLKEEIKANIECIKDLESFSNYKNILTEKEIVIPIEKSRQIYFTGKIDKIMYEKNMNDTYFVVIDYKTGYATPNIYDLKYGLNMQLPIYLYLVSSSKVFNDPIFTGMYLQKSLISNFNWEANKSVEQMRKNELKLNGYSIDNVCQLQRFDPNYENSELIKSMKINKDSSFSKNSKILSDSEVYQMINYTDKIIKETKDFILDGNFKIEPKVIDKDIACDKCQYKDICFVTKKDYIYLEKQKNLDFLEVE